MAPAFDDRFDYNNDGWSNSRDLEELRAKLVETLTEKNLKIKKLEKENEELESENKELKEKINQMSAALYNIRQWTYIGFLSKKEVSIE